MREAGKVCGWILRELANIIQPGISTLEIDRFVEKTVREHGMRAAEKGYCGYPASVCVSVNDEVVHGIPSKKRHLREGDIVSCDLVVEYDGYMADAARTYAVGKISPEAKHLIETAERAFWNGIAYAKAGKGPRLQRGMTLAVEPMITQGSWEIDVLTDDWTAVTVDGGLAAHYENTVVITDGEPELLTL